MATIKGGVPKPLNTSREEMDAFINGAPGKVGYPWQDPKIRRDLLVQTQVRLPDDLNVKVRWLAEKEGTTLRKFIQAVMYEGVNARLKKYGAPE